MIYRSNMYEVLLSDSHPNYSFSGDVGLTDMVDLLTRRKGSISLPEFSVDGLRFDLLSLDPIGRRVSVFEFKTNRDDLLRDDKWWRYAFYCDRFSFCTPLIDLQREFSRKRDCHPEDGGFGVLQVFRWTRRGEGGRSGIGGVWAREPVFDEISDRVYDRIAALVLTRLAKEGKLP